MKTRHLLFLTVFFLSVFALLALDIRKDNGYNLAKREILMRQIGHQILLHSGDSTSRVLPVTKLGNEKYRLVFDQPFAFETDTLVSIVKRTLSSSNETSDYIVNVLDCPGLRVVYGYSVSRDQKDNVIPCSGRKQQTDCYLITVEFRDQAAEMRTYAAGISALALLVLCPLVVWRFRRKPSVAQPATSNNQMIPIGNLVFDKAKKQLRTATEMINLTSKESKILLIFAQHPNQVIDRARLQKEIWEDDGVIVGRSLDVFISKLRKKLESDTSVQLVNIHGKGYKLQILLPEN